jgi:hypothetical protein
MMFKEGGWWTFVDYRAGCGHWKLDTMQIVPKIPIQLRLFCLQCDNSSIWAGAEFTSQWVTDPTESVDGAIGD